jgi:uncharacterized protein DUF4129
MDARRLLPFIAGLVVLAFALGSLSRSEPGGSLLFHSYWLLYILYLGPIVILGIMILMIAMIAINWREISAAVGFQMAKQRKQRKKKSRLSTFVAAAIWGLAFAVLFFRKGSIFNPNPPTNATVTQIVGANPAFPIPIPAQFAGFLPAFSSLIDNGWFSYAFLGLVIVGGLIIVQSIRESMKETRDENIEVLKGNQQEGLKAVLEAINLVDNESKDPRTRIIACYQHLLMTASRLGAPVSPGMTARELERGICSTFSFEGTAINDLTQLFEISRYSLHEILEKDAQKARADLESIANELNVELTV